MIDDTIVAISTQIGESAIGIVRMSGEGSLKIADRLFKGKDGVLPSRFKSHTVRYGWVSNKCGTSDVQHQKVIDEVLLTVMRAPKTYTREDIVEISCHGGAMALRNVLELVIKCGARLAEPGEFTKRAFLNGRIDLSKAEAVLDIIRAKTESALKLGLEQLSGGLSERIKQIRKELIDILANIEASIDFPEEDIEPNVETHNYACLAVRQASLQNKLKHAINQLETIIQDSQKVNFFREGIKVSICGRPNVGKSSLLNALLRKERAIVTPIAGTTRDVIEEFINIDGIGIRLIDTAGFVKPRDLIEHHAIRLTKDSIALSDLVLLVFDAGAKLTSKDYYLIKELKGKDVIAVLNKIDLPQRIERDKIKREFRRIVSVSAKLQRNLDKLEDAIVNLVYKGKIITSEGLTVTNTRQLEQIRQAKELLEKAGISLKDRLSPEFIALDLKLGLDCLGRITGETVDDAILDRIFSEFCIGK